jgi:uncharacterized protein YjbI with pentapeptide repeats
VALQTYIDHMSELLLEKNLRTSKEDDEVKNIATARTLTVLPNLDHQRKRSVINFLHDTGLIKVNEAVINLMEADLSEAHMFKANLKGANLSLTKMNGVDLGEADLSGAIVTKEQLETVKSLKGATLSDGSIHP